jgi:hypothetical protein
MVVSVPHPWQLNKTGEIFQAIMYIYLNQLDAKVDYGCENRLFSFCLPKQHS